MDSAISGGMRTEGKEGAEDLKASLFKVMVRFKREVDPLKLT